ncbi:MAG: chemotaxis protein CheD [Ruminiclostridium sp.]|nr:chemotaxis protein CheD [Ruminiclostridium sp.]
MGQKLIIGISDWKIGKGDDVLVTYALGSCIGTCIYDRTTGIAGLSHIMLPDSTAIIDGHTTRMKFADTALPDMVDRMRAMGANVPALKAKIAGGAVMFQTANSRFNIGERNIEAVKAALAKLRIPILAEDVGLNYGRTMTFWAENGAVEISSTVMGKKML